MSVQLISVFLRWASVWMHQRAGEGEKTWMINDSAARHLSIDCLTPINEGQRSLCFIKVATYEILKWAWLQHNTELQRTGPDLLQKENEEGEKKEDGKSRRNRADSIKDSGNTPISVSETEAAKLRRAEYRCKRLHRMSEDEEKEMSLIDLQIWIKTFTTFQLELH